MVVGPKWVSKNVSVGGFSGDFDKPTLHHSKGYHLETNWVNQTISVKTPWCNANHKPMVTCSISLLSSSPQVAVLGHFISLANHELSQRDTLKRA